MSAQSHFQHFSPHFTGERGGFHLTEEEAFAWKEDQNKSVEIGAREINSVTQTNACGGGIRGFL